MFRFGSSSRKKKTTKTPAWVLSIVALSIVLIIALPFFFLRHHFALTQHPGWNPTEVQVLGTRVVTVGARDSGNAYAATFYYRAEAEVQYEANSKKYDLWLPASRTTSDRAELELWLSDKKARYATVLWNPKKPGEGEVKLKSDMGSYFADFD
jgi:hypothetical protein